jgi:hypothetical protein
MGGATTEAIRQKFEPRCAMGEKVVYECWIGDEDTDVTFTGAKQVGAMRAGVVQSQQGQALMIDGGDDGEQEADG